MIEIAVSKKLADMTLDVDLKMPTVGLTAVFGRSGSGKTTLINVLAGLVDPDVGLVKVNGDVLFDSSRKIKIPVYERKLGYVFQDSRLFPHMTVQNNLRYGYSKAGQIEFDEIVALLDVGPLLRRRPHNLSGGEKQRVAIGRALLTNPSLLLMDEPLSALDETRKNEIMPFILRIRDAMKIPIFYVTHSRAEVEKMASHTVVLSKGRPICSGSISEVAQALDVITRSTKAAEELP